MCIPRRTNTMDIINNKRRMNNVNFSKRELAAKPSLRYFECMCVCHGIMSAINVISRVTFHFLLPVLSNLIVIAMCLWYFFSYVPLSFFFIFFPSLSTFSSFVVAVHRRCSFDIYCLFRSMLKFIEN